MNSVEFITNEVSVNSRRRELHYVKPIGDHALYTAFLLLSRTQSSELLFTGIGLTKWLASQNNSPHKTCGNLGSLYIEPYSFYFMKEKAFIDNFQGMIMT